VKPKDFEKGLTADRLREVVTYHPEIGNFTWNIRQKKIGGYFEIGDKAGFRECSGYWIIGIDRQQYKAHRLAWLWMTGKWPKEQIDHINLDNQDNRWNNLREASHRENCTNKHVRSDNILGVKGVWLRRNGKYEALITRDQKRYHLGQFETVEQAKDAYDMASSRLHGEFSRTE